MMIKQDIWYQLLGEIVRYRRDKGFEPAIWETAGARFACIAAEIWELEEALGLFHVPAASAENYSDQHIRDECAGIAMYVLGMQLDLGLEPGTQRTSLMQRVPRFASPAEITVVLREHWRAAFEAWRKNDPKDTAVSLEILLAAVFHIRDRVLGITGSLVEDCMANLLTGASRPWRHGGKHPLT